MPMVRGKAMRHTFAKKSKYNAERTKRHNRNFDSIVEADYFDKLLMLQKAGEVVMFLWQVPLHLDGGTKLVVDFQVFWKDGSVTFEDVKGMVTDVFKIKKREVEAKYPIEIKIIKRKDI